MMTQTSLSAAAPQYRGGPPWCAPPAYPEVRRGYPEGRGFIPSINDRTIVPLPPAQPHPRSPFPATSHPPLATEVLIANADAASIGILSDQRESKGLFLIANLELEFHLTHRKLSPLQTPNRKFSSLLYLFTNDQSRVTSHRFLIHGSAIKTPRNPFKNNNLTNSNRRQTGGLGNDFRSTIRRTPAPSTTD